MRRVAGELRKSQTISTFGIGAMVDLPALSVILMGLGYWKRQACPLIEEPRLLRAVQQVLGAQVDEIREGPDPSEANGGMFPMDAHGIPVAVFPRWLRCPLCSMLASVDSGHFELRPEPFHVDRLRYIHANCSERKTLRDSRMPGAVPARFVIACNHGHLDDFPWIDYAHRGTPCSRPTLRLFEMGVTGEAADVFVKCEACGIPARAMSEAFSPSDARVKETFPCSGYHPHLRIREECQAPEATPILIGASNSYFPLVLSLLSLPKEGNPLLEQVQSAWATFREVEEVGELRFLRRRGDLEDLETYSDDDLWQAIQAVRAGAGPTGDALDVKRPEWNLFSSGRSLSTSSIIHLRPVDVPRGFERWIERVVLVEKHLEVRALVGFTRIESTGDISDLDTLPRERRGPLARPDPWWVPGVRMRGEGIFVQFREDTVAAWERERESGLRARDAALWKAHANWCSERPWMPAHPPFPGARFVMIHSFSHALMRELGIRCGYGTASIRERIHCASRDDPNGPMAGVLLATASPDSEGTLGGLVALGEPIVLGSLLRMALERLAVCASDPMCATYQPEHRSNLHGSACHCCTFVPETSCERSNHFLDRALLVETMANLRAEFFKGR
jgi:hypothetical protein